MESDRLIHIQALCLSSSKLRTNDLNSLNPSLLKYNVSSLCHVAVVEINTCDMASAVPSLCRSVRGVDFVL